MDSLFRVDKVLDVGLCLHGEDAHTIVFNESNHDEHKILRLCTPDEQIIQHGQKTLPWET